MPDYTNQEASKQMNAGNRDDSQSWRAGVFYANRDDARLLVEKRSGLGMTFNFAHPISWCLLAVIIALTIALAVILPLLLR